MAEIWGATLAAAAIGAGAAVYGSNKQSKASAAATAANQQTQADQNQAAWNNYLLTRGLYGNNAPTGTIPTNATAVNTRLPLWAMVSRTANGRLMLPGTSAPAPGGTSGSAPTFNGKPLNFTSWWKQPTAA